MMKMVSLMCVAPEDIEKAIKKIEETEDAGYHIDIVDRDFDLQGKIIETIYKKICEESSKIKEVHLMASNPKEHIEEVCALNPDIIYISYKVDHFDDIVEAVKSHGIELGVVLESFGEFDTDTVVSMTSYCNKFMILTVIPKSIGGIWLPSAEKNIQTLLSLKAQYHFEIELDGAISKDIMDKYFLVGVENFVCGTKSGFLKEFAVKRGQL